MHTPSLDSGLPAPASFEPSASLDRRQFLAACSAAGLAQTLFPGALLGLAAQTAVAQDGAGAEKKPHPAAMDPEHLPPITEEMIEAAATVAGLSLTKEQRAMLVSDVAQLRKSAVTLRKLDLPNRVAPAFVFNPLPAGMAVPEGPVNAQAKLGPAPDVAALKAAAGVSREEAICFATVRELAELVRTRHISSAELTKLYLDRLRRFNPTLHFVVNFTEERALPQAAAADREIAAGKYRGPLHGIPWGAKDLFSVKGYPATWGVAGLEHQTFDEDAEIVQRLDRAGAVLLAKMSMGAFATGDFWGSGTRTRNPWNPKQGSSGSSAGSASAVAAGCVGFAIGTETLGSISSPSSRCGTSGLRPTFGMVPRTGAMALSWTMDKTGPFARSVEDCAIILGVIAGPDQRDHACLPAAYQWDASFDWRTLRVGYIASGFEAKPYTDPPAPEGKTETAEEAEKRKARAKAQWERNKYDIQLAGRSLDVLRNKMGVKLTPVELLADMPKGFDVQDIVPVLSTEGSAAFERWTLTGEDQVLPSDGPHNERRNSYRFYSATDYIQAQRARTLLIESMAKVFRDVDVLVTPSSGPQLSITNLTGHPAVIVPDGLRGPDAPPPMSEADGARDNIGGPGTTVTITFLGGLFSDAKLAAFASAYQRAAGNLGLHPKLG